MLRRLFKRNERELSEEEIAQLEAQVAEYGEQQIANFEVFSEQVADTFEKEARARIEAMPDGPEKEELRELSEQMIASHRESQKKIQQAVSTAIRR